DWRARRGEACLVPAPKSDRPDLQAEPFDAGPRRAFFSAPRYDAAAFAALRLAGAFALRSAVPARAAARVLWGRRRLNGGDRTAFRGEPSFCRALVLTMG
ncbi:MAG: hypothetical protein KJN97_15575, partial [Deltaproteobacteria bacterium]|nr:hypothetical protein [Deltaproteobacteria bacterium]